MGYVALSRVRSLGGMKLLGFNDMSLEVDSEVLEKDREFQKMSESARRVLDDMSNEEVLEKQKQWMKKIEPEESVKIRRKEKEENKEIKKSTQEITAGFLEQEVPLEDIAEARGVKQETIVSHIEDLLAEDRKNCPDITYLKRELKRSELDEILTAFKKCKTTTLSPVFNYLHKEKKKTTYLKIRLARLFL
jgi:uncharacterized protein YpbB